MVSAIPNVPMPIPSTSSSGVKVATPEIVDLSYESLPVDIMASLIFESIGGVELLSLSRHDTVNGQRVIYSPIVNSADVGIQYNSVNLIENIDSSNRIFKNFPLKFVNYIPGDDSPISIDATNGDILIAINNISATEEVEIQMFDSLEAYNDTIYVEAP
jgi:hypothetical protein